MKPDIEAEIIDITKKSAYERYLYRCLAPMPFRKHRKRQEYLEAAIPRGFHKKPVRVEISPAKSPFFYYFQPVF